MKMMMICSQGQCSDEGVAGLCRRRKKRYKGRPSPPLYQAELGQSSYYLASNPGQSPLPIFIQPRSKTRCRGQPLVGTTKSWTIKYQCKCTMEPTLSDIKVKIGFSMAKLCVILSQWTAHTAILRQDRAYLQCNAYNPYIIQRYTTQDVIIQCIIQLV